MADNTQLNPGSGGDVIATDDIGGVKYQRVKPSWGSNGVAVDVDAVNPLPTSTNASIFRFSTANSSTVQLAPGASFDGVIESGLDQPSISILVTSDTAVTVSVFQYIDLAGTYAVTPIVYNVAANQGLSASVAMNGNYVRVAVKNTGAETTTKFNLNVAYGNLPTSDGSGKVPINYEQADAIVYLLSAMLEKMPRLTREDRVMVSVGDASQNELNSQYYGVSSNLVGESGGRQYSRIMEPWNFADVGSARLYQNIIVS